jgi:hypothetical protein
MSVFFDFLTTVSTDSVLKVIAKEARSEEKRTNSKTLLYHIRVKFPTIQHASDWVSFKTVIATNVQFLDYTYDDDEEAKETLGTWLGMIRAVTIASHHVERSTVLCRFTELTAIFKGYYLTVYPELDTYPIIQFIRNILRVDSTTKRIVQVKCSQNRTKRLTKCYELHIDTIIRAMQYFMDKNVGLDPHFTEWRDATALKILTVGAAIGTRKTEVISPAIKFYTLSQWRELHQDCTIMFGTIPVPNLLTEFDDDKIIVQEGTLKNAAQRNNKFLEEGDERRVADLVLMKPVIEYTASEVVKAICDVRHALGTTAKQTRTNTQLSNLFIPEKCKAALAEVFPDGFKFSSHVMRKIYVVRAWNELGDRLKKVTGVNMDRSVFLNALLGHGASLDTTLNYSNIKIVYDGVEEKGQVAPPRKKRQRRFISPAHRVSYVRGQMKKHRVTGWSPEFMKASGISPCVYKRAAADGAFI